MAVLWLDDVRADDIERVGGKGASLGEMTSDGLPVPPAFIVTAETYRSFIEETGIDEELFEVIDVDTEDSGALADAAERAQTLIRETPIPESIREEVLAAYEEIGTDTPVAVRSSATAEDLPSIAADESALVRVDGEPVFGRMAEIAPVDCDRQTVEVPSLTDDGIVWREVEQLYEHPAEEGTLYRVTTETGRQITVTPDHSLVVLDEATLEPETATVDDLDGDEKVPVVRELAPMGDGPDTVDVSEYVSGGDVIRTDGGLIIDNNSSNESIQHSLPRTIRADGEFAYFLGLYVAEGSTYGGNEISITNTDDAVLDRATGVMDRLGLWNDQTKNGQTYRFHCKSLVRFLHAVAGEPDDTTGTGRLAGNKRVPEFVFGWDRARIGVFLRGCFDGDGTVHDELGYATTSERVVDGVTRLLELLGIDYRIREREGNGDWSDSYIVNIPAREAKRFRERVGFESPSKADRLDDLVERHEGKEYYPEFSRTITVGDELSSRIRAAFDGTVAWETIEAVEQVEYDGPVYDFCVPEAENFAAGRGSVITHNTASFAGQQETFLNVTGEDLLDRVRECWASLFTQRALYYRNEQGFADDIVNIAVVVQEMVEADKSGVLFTSHPSTGAPVVTIEAAWGLGEAVVSGAVTPDNYVIDRETGEVREETVAEKKVMHVRGETGETVEREVPAEKRTERVLSDDELEELLEVGELVEGYYGDPQDVEWAISDGTVYLLQSRPITTIDDDATQGGVADGGAGAVAGDDTSEVVLSGIGASPGKASGEASIVGKLDELDKVGEGDIIVAEMTTPDMVPAMKRAAGIVTDEGGMTSHAAIVSRELGVPAVVGAETATEQLTDGQLVTIDGETGAVEAGDAIDDAGDAEGEDDEQDAVEAVRPETPVKPMTATEVKVNVSIPEAAERAAATGADGVGLLRIEHMILSLGKTPEQYIEDNSAEAYVERIVEGIQAVADEFYPRPVRARTLDAPTDEFRQLEGGEAEPIEHNPMLGYRGIRRSLDRPDVFRHELEAFRKIYEMGYDNVELMFPLVNDREDVSRAKALLSEAGIDPEKRSWGVMIETPAAALSVDRMAEEGIDFASFGTNDLTQYTLAVDRNNEQVADRYDELHPAVLELIGETIERCRERGVDTSICGQAGSRTEMAEFLVEEGITSISANIDAVRDVQHEVKRVEQRLLLDAIR
ncbi:MAG: phosphoenolpyruvate synthase [Halovenus sp.]